MNGKSAREIVEVVIGDIDAGRELKSPRGRTWARVLVGPVAIGMAMGLAGCPESTGEDPETQCFDGVDNDGDGFVDCCDGDCVDLGDCVPACPAYGGPYEEEDCSDCRDDYDCDGLIDCDDDDCDDDPACM